MLTDCHAHLHVDAFDADRTQAIERAQAAGVSRLINVGFEVEGNFKAIALANKYDFIYATMGIHPHSVSEWNHEVGEKIISTCKREAKIVALGEMGLDYFKNFQPRELQLSVFRAQLVIAQKLELPVIIHCRDAFDDLFQILPDYTLPGVLLHCFTGSLTYAKEAWSRGYYTAFTGIVTYPSATELQKVAQHCPPDKIIVETDCPYLAPQSKRGQRNEPSFLVETAQHVAKLRGMAYEKFCHQVAKNTDTLFRF